MSKVEGLTKITGATGTQSPSFTNGFNIAGADSGISGFIHTESDTEPSSPSNGDTWWSETASEYKVYANGVWQTVIGTASSTTADPTTFSFDYDSYLATVPVSGTSNNVLTQNIRFSADGTKLHVLGHQRDAVYYDLSTAWDISTATIDQNKSFSNLSGATNDEPFDIMWDAASLDFNSNGTAILSTVHTASYHRLRGWNLNTAYDILSASSTTPAVDRTFTTTTLNNIWNGIKDTSHRNNFTSSGYDYRSKWIDSGNKFVWYEINTGGVGGKMLIFNVTTAYDPSTIDVTSSGALSCFDFGYEIENNIDPTRYDTSGAAQYVDFWFSDDGTKIWVDGRKDYTDAQSNTVTACDLFVFETSVAWDISKSNMTHVKTIRLGEDAVSPNWKLTERIRSFYVNESEQKVYIGLQELYPSASGSDVLSGSYGVAEFSYGSSSSGGSGGSTSSIAWGGDRHVYSIGYDSGWSNKIEYQSITTAGNATDFGDTLGSTYRGAACGNGSRGVFSGGMTNTAGSETNVMQYITTSTTGNATDFGDLTAVKNKVMATSDGTRGLIAAGFSNAQLNIDVIEYITIATTGNGTDFGDLSTELIDEGSAFNDATRSVFNDGNFNVATAIMEYVTTQTLGNSTDFGDHLNGKQHGACSDATRGLICGGDTAAAGNTRTNVISYVTTQTASNSADFGDLTVARSRCGVASDGTYATIVGGRPVNVPSNVTGVIDKVTVQTAANATDYGDMLTEGQYIESVSGAAS